MIDQSDSVKIGELGIAPRLKQRRSLGRPLGTTSSLRYLSPEAARGGVADERSDIFSLGASLHHILSGAPPFQAENLKELSAALLQELPQDLRDIRGDVTDRLALLVRSMLAKDPASRPPTAALVGRNLETILSSLPLVRAPGSSLARRAWLRWIGRYLLATLCFLLGGGLGFFLLNTGRMASQRSARLQRVRKIIAEGMELLRSGDLEAAIRKRGQLSRIRGAPEDWDLLGPEMRAFENALESARRKAQDLSEENP